MTYGFRQAGIPVMVGVDIDASCRFPIEANNTGTLFVEKSVSDLAVDAVSAWYPKDVVRVLIGCAPCQPFSKYAVRNGPDERWRLLYDFLRLVRGVRPDIVSMENVPQLKLQKHPAYLDFVAGLEAEGYWVSDAIVHCGDYGVPQTRRRLVLIAGAGRSIDLISPSHHRHRTVRDAIGELPPIGPGGEPPANDPLHIAPRLSATNLERIRTTPEGGNWHDWPEKLRLACHLRSSGRYYGSVYGRMAWNKPGPTVTTQCYGYGNGRFGHPEQDRAISLREAALLQTFPQSYQFVSPGQRPRFRHVGRHIGNAVPVELGRAIALSIKRSYAVRNSGRGDTLQSTG